VVADLRITVCFFSLERDPVSHERRRRMEIEPRSWFVGTEPRVGATTVWNHIVWSSKEKADSIYDELAHS
jgi:hypothetical protein